MVEEDGGSEASVDDNAFAILLQGDDAISASANTAEPVLSVRLLGRPQILVHGQDVSREVKYRKGFAALGYLAVHANTWVRREQLASLLWPRLNHAAALTNLRQVLNNLRAVLNTCGVADIIRSDRTWLGFFHTPGCCLDVAWLTKLQLAESSQHHACVEPESLGGDFLEGVEVSDGDEFDSWLHLTRQHLRNCFLTLMEARCLHQQRQPQSPEAIRTAHRLAQQNPLDEHAAATLITLLRESGARRAALNVFDTLQDQLGRELHAVPGDTLQSLRQSLLP
ncbi:BTAD domain-containing putative transcriptional regulator [Uliginosibacterium sp. 31-16]|uniref:AfsR/SARP family transcriptional regulator n=1 Tax=Uliginosibacterium sp. 31-16 TaxID=3068315 RepID=UPI00273D8DFE|nr:BTAD domain-containing putative transcriptional regulator [Uliginosibacterium sp. 31-16]MDP5238560.1 BTAD domain-containing putative transcriptional regulator [Uliginosibacterium sp. 31-16]